MPDETFRVEDGCLVRAVVPRRGRPYEHRCPEAACEAVAHAVDEAGDRPFTLADLAERTGLPWTQANTALAFLKERGCVVPAPGRQHRAAPANQNGGVHLDAMAEFHALRETGPDA